MSAIMATVSWLAVWSPEGGHDAGHGALEWITPVFGNDGKTGVVWLFLNFAVLMWILNKILFKGLRAKTALKHDTIKAELDKATSARTEAEAILGEYRGRLDRLDGEVDELMADAKRRAESDREAIIEQAKKEAERIKAAAVAAGEREADARRRTIENEVIDRAIDRAGAIIRDKISADDQQKMFSDYLTSLDKVQFAGPGGRKESSQ